MKVVILFEYHGLFCAIFDDGTIYLDIDLLSVKSYIKRIKRSNPRYTQLALILP